MQHLSAHASLDVPLFSLTNALISVTELNALLYVQRRVLGSAMPFRGVAKGYETECPALA